MSSELRSFNIVAIQIFDDCALHIRKVLSKKWYFFTQQYTLDENEETIIKNKSYNVPANFYNDKISIQAIVGMNGSGKSCILECVFRIINNISYQILHKIQRQDSHELVPVDGIHAEVYFNFEGNLISIGCKKNSYYYRRYNVEKKINDNGSINDISSENKKFLSGFCYTIVCNYSQHAYNALTLPKKEYYIDNESKVKNIWLNGLFHKNDGYLTPIVLNPYRENGNINFNTENYLANVRLASLFIALKEKDVDLMDGYEAVSIRYTYNSTHFRSSYNNLKKRWDTTTSDIISFDELSEEILQIYNIDKVITDKYLINIGYQYLIYKTLTILEKYPSYSNPYNCSPETCRVDGKKKFLFNLRREISRIQGENSHITLKIKQVINYINNPTFKKVNEISIEQYINKPSSFGELSRIDQIITEFLPSFFSIDTVLYKTTDEKKLEPIPFESMSSGERQFLVIMASVMYHLKNINSIPNKATLRIKYKYVFLVLEEIELYFHPEYQRQFIFNLLEYIKKLDLKLRGINICIATHSPFVLSDIPKDNILFLEMGKPILNEESKKFKTFGANIFDILQSPFFMKDGFIGKFAWKKITNIETDLDSNEKNIDNILKEISVVDEPHIQSYLLSKLEKSSKKKSLESQKIELEQKLAQINAELNDKN